MKSFNDFLCRWRLLGAVIVFFWAMIPQAVAQVSAGGTPPSESLALSRVIPVTVMPAVDTLALFAEDEQSGNDPYRFASQTDVNLNLKNSGKWDIVPGGRLWRLRIASPNAYSIGLLYDEWYIPKGGQLFLYNNDRSQVIGAFTEANNWQGGRNITQHVAGDATTLEYFEPASVNGRSRLSIYKVCHAYRNLFGRGSLDSYGQSDWCEHNINCPEYIRWRDEQRGIAMIIHNNVYQCSGSMINPYTPGLTALPYFLTANHCWNSGDSLWIFYFNYESPGCANQNGPLNQTLANAQLKARWATSDFALYQLSGVPPMNYNVYLNGWTRTESGDDSSVCIHHPMGDIKKISVDRDDAVTAGWPACDNTSTHWKVSHWEAGRTESGSSGSPLMNAYSSQIIGQLSGICGSCTCTACSSYFGRLSQSWTGGGHTYDGLRHWLDPDSTLLVSMTGAYFYGPQNDACPGSTIAALPFMGGGSTAAARNDWSNCVGPYSQDVFYNYTPTCDMTITASLCTASYNTGLGVYSLFNGDCYWAMLVGCNDNNILCADGTHSQLTFEATADVEYVFDVHGSERSSGNFILTVTGVNHVISDSCPGITIPGLPYTHQGNTSCSVNNYNNCVFPTSKDEVFNFTATQTQTLVASLCGSSYDTGLEIRTHGACPGDSQVACNDDFACVNTLNSQVTFRADAGTTYYLIVHGWYTHCGPYRLEFYVQPAAAGLVIQAVMPLVHLNWSRVVGASTFFVYRDSTAGFIPSSLNRIGVTSDTTFVDPQALTLPGTRYFYVVTAEYSSIFSTPPPPPADFLKKQSEYSGR